MPKTAAETAAAEEERRWQRHHALHFLEAVVKMSIYVGLCWIFVEYMENWMTSLDVDLPENHERVAEETHWEERLLSRDLR